MGREVIQEAIENQSRMAEEELLLSQDIEKINVAAQHSLIDKGENTDEESELVKFENVGFLEAKNQFESVIQKHAVYQEPQSSQNFQNLTNFQSTADFQPANFQQEFFQERPFRSHDLDYEEALPSPAPVIEIPQKYPPV